MHKLKLPDVDDAAAIKALSENTDAASYPALSKLLPVIQKAYVDYEAAGGSPFDLRPGRVPKRLAKQLRAHYAAPPKNLAFIKELRNSEEHKTCPMCGSLHCGTLDHWLPKRTYPAFAVFSRNLVRACKCNIRRKTLLTGSSPGERLLHPYFDNCLNERLVRAKFSDLGPVPRVELSVVAARSHAAYAAIAFHVDTILSRSAVRKYLADRWSDLYRKPHLVVRALEANPADVVELKHWLVKELDLLDDHHGSKNNWNSMFVAGLLEPAVIRWILGRMHAPGRVAGGPLG